MIYGPSKHDFRLWENSVRRDLKHYGVPNSFTEAQLHDLYYVHHCSVRRVYSIACDMDAGSLSFEEAVLANLGAK